MPEMHLRQLGFTHTACGLFTTNKERIQKKKQKTKNNKNSRFKIYLYKKKK